ncbi:GGDEF domain-containing protein [Thiomicrospira microaerophila]|uniref:GGDEF domain-containing protein n=1 Tax=Thiomicrospira microaerophila TaxID=406020 RepID=UPI00069893DA|nr:GGDEF domain-containing protein [Thiomicrospira microaerophila]
MSRSPLRYPDSPSESAIIAEQVFKEIKALKVAATPVHFTLLYEKSSQLDPELAENLTELIEAEEYNDLTVYPLFLDLLKSILNQQLPTKEVGSLLSEALTSISSWSAQSCEQQKTLEKSIDFLKSHQQHHDVVSHTEHNILPAIKELHQATGELQKKLNESAAVIKKLSRDLDDANHLAKTDSLTGIANRRGYNEIVMKKIKQAKAESQTFGMLLLDLDHFKSVNDNYGHLVGDSALRYISKLLKAEIKGHDEIARFGGEEFVILLHNINYDNALKFGEKLRATIEKKSLRIKDHDKPLRLTASIGIAIYQMGESSDDVFQRADKALYMAKTKRNCVRGEHQL